MQQESTGRGQKFWSQPGHVTLVETDREIMFAVKTLPSADS